MRMKALLALLGLGLLLLLFAGCSDNSDNIDVVNTLAGTVTNASTSLPEEGATVTLFQNSVEVDSTITNSDGEFTFNDVADGTGYSIVVSSPTSAFADVTFGPFDVFNDILNINIVVGSGIVGSTVSGTIGTIEPTAIYDVSIIRNNVVVATTTAGPAVEPTFTLTNVPPNDNYIIVVEEQDDGIITLYGPVTVPEGGLTGINVIVKTASQLSADGIPSPIPPTNGTATLVSYVTGGSTISIDGGTPCSLRNPSFITGVNPGLRTITITNNVGQTVTFTINVPANTVLVFRPVF